VQALILVDDRRSAVALGCPGMARTLRPPTDTGDRVVKIVFRLVRSGILSA
jgi:hypothetical protein